MKVIVRDGCGTVTLPHTALTLELGDKIPAIVSETPSASPKDGDDSTFYRWECPPLTETEIDEWVESARRNHFLAAVQ